MTLMNTLIVLPLVCMHVQAARMQVQDLVTGKTDFQCPPECLECCDSTRFFGLFSRSFKCIPKNKEKVPEGRECKEVKRRNSFYAQYKTHCKYADDEKVATEGTCSTKSLCCCATNGNWEESKCYEGRGENGIRKEKADHTGQLETFKIRKAQTFANTKQCLRQGNVHHPYNFAGRIPGTHGKPSSTSTRATGCCLKTSEHHVTHRWSTRHTRRMGKVTSHYSRPHTRGMDYTICDEHEELHYCSSDDGVTQNDNMFVYDSVSAPQDGICIGNKIANDGKLLSEIFIPYGKDYECPKSTFTGDWCHCADKCGYHRHEQ